MNVTITKEYHSIDEVKQSFPTEKIEGTIFRGQSNGTGIKQEPWDLKSSFNRIYNYTNISFQSYLIHLKDLLPSNNIESYKYQKLIDSKEWPFREKLYLLQHYGLPTCLIDFSHNPMVALFFAMAGIQYKGSFYDQEKYTHFNEDRFISVFEIDTKTLKKIFPVIKTLNNDIEYLKDEYKFSKSQPFKLALDIHPKTSDTTINQNMKNQEGCFILYDSSFENLDLIKALEYDLKIRKDDYNEDVSYIKPFITEHRCFLRDLITPNNKSLIHFITKEHGVSGKILFDDIQGIKYDLNYAPLSWTI